MSALGVDGFAKSAFKERNLTRWYHIRLAWVNSVLRNTDMNLEAAKNKAEDCLSLRHSSESVRLLGHIVGRKFWKFLTLSASHARV